MWLNHAKEGVPSFCEHQGAPQRLPGLLAAALAGCPPDRGPGLPPGQSTTVALWALWALIGLMVSHLSL